MKIFFVSLLLISGLGAYSQPKSYDALSIPETLKNGANVVKRFENTTLTINKIDDVVIDHHEVYTVLNDDGKRYLFFNEFTNKFRSIDEAEIRVYDALGTQTGRYKKKEMMTQAVGEGLIDDGYVTFYMVETNNYPITVEFKYQVKQSGTLVIPNFNISAHKVAVEQANFTVKVPDEIGLRFLLKNTDVKPETSKDGKMTVYKWSVSNVPALVYEEGGGSAESRFPHVQLALNRFSIYGQEGDMSSWKNFGQWLNILYRDLDVLPAEKIAFFKDLVKDAKDDSEKAKIIYQYLQRNFRYVSIQLGIGGFKPFSASFTEQKKYGDCKGLSNYMKAALKAVGVKSHIAIINSGYDDEPVRPDFPVNNFNHAILCIPQPKDSIWLECTSSTLDFNELSTSTENRYALLVTDEGGVLVPTPESKSSSNVVRMHTKVELFDDGTGITETSFYSTGSYKSMIERLLKAKKDDQKEIIVLGMGFKQPDDFEIKKHETSDAAVLKMAIEKMPEFRAGTKIFLAPRIYKIFSSKLPKSDQRKSDYYFPYPFMKFDTTVYKLPEGYIIDALPAAKDLSCKHGKFSATYRFDEQTKTVTSIVSLELKKHLIPASDYPELKKFFDEVLVNDGQRIVIKKL